MSNYSYMVELRKKPVAEAEDVVVQALQIHVDSDELLQVFP